jgi:DNA-binding protein HU-beta
LVEDGSVILVGHGTYTVTTRAARTGRDPRTGGTLHIPEKKVLSFKAGKALKDAINEKALEAASA